MSSSGTQQERRDAEIHLLPPPRRFVEAQDGETAGALMTFFLALGLSLGAALSFPLRAVI